MPQSKIRVFWDLETCPPPIFSYTSPWEILKDLRLFTSNFGVVTAIKPYWNSNRDRGTQNTAEVESFRTAIRSMGMEPMDRSLTKGYEQDTPAKRLTVDVLISAIDDPMNSDTSAEDIIMILSGDYSVLYTISLLMLRKYTVFLVVPDEDNNVEQSQATRIFNWHRDVLGFKLKETNLNTQKPQSSQAQDIAQRTPISPLDTATAATSSIHSSLSRVVKSNAVSSATPKSNAKSLPTSESSVSGAPSALDSAPQAFDSYLSATSRGERAPAKPKPSGSDIRSQMLRQISSLPEDTGSNHGWGGDAGGSWDAGGNWDAGSSWDTGGSWEIADNAAVAWAPELVEESGAGRTKNFKLGAETTKDFDTSHQVEPGHSGAQSGVPKEVPLAAFDPLLQVLRENKKRSMGRSNLGQELGKNKSIYKVAGVKGFAEYIALAVENKVVIAGGADKDQYVRLHPRLKNSQ